ncbi:MAG: GFA family protein [Pseudomonadota bacterium]
MSEERSAQCLCGAVKFRATPTRPEMGVCHCSMCRRWTGGTFMAVECKPDVSFDCGEDKVQVYASSPWGERVFCSICGASLFWRTKDRSHWSVSAQAFDESSRFTFTAQIFIDEKPANYSFADETMTMTGAEVFEAVMGGKEH